MGRIEKQKRELIEESNKRILMESDENCDTEWETVKNGLEDALNKNKSIDITSNLCTKNQTEFIKTQVSGINSEKIDCVNTKISEWCKPKGYNYSIQKQKQTPTTTKSEKQIEGFEVVNNNEWSKIPEQTKGYLLFLKGILKATEKEVLNVPHGKQLKTYYENNKEKFSGSNFYVFYVSNKVMYFIPINFDDGPSGYGPIEIEKGTKKEFIEFYGDGKSEYNTLPKGSTDYLIIKKTNDVNRSFLVVLKNGEPCLTYLFKSSSDNWGHKSKCWTV